MSSFDKKSFSNLIEGDKELFSTLLQLFKEDWPNILQKLEKAIDSGSPKIIEQMGHRIKGNLKNFYAEDAAKVALEIEEAGRENKISDLKPRVDHLKTLILQVETDLESFYSSLN